MFKKSTFKRIVAVDVLTHRQYILDTPQELLRLTGGATAGIRKYLESPEVGDWPVLGYYWRHQDMLGQYPFRFIDPLYLYGISLLPTPRTLIYIKSPNLSGTAFRTITELSKATGYNMHTLRHWLKDPFNVPKGILISQLSNPRGKNPTIAKIAVKVKGTFATETLDKAIRIPGISLDNNEYIKYTYSKDKVKLTKRFYYGMGSLCNDALLTHVIDYVLTFKARLKELSKQNDFKTFRVLYTKQSHYALESYAIVSSTNARWVWCGNRTCTPGQMLHMLQTAMYAQRTLTMASPNWQYACNYLQNAPIDFNVL